MSRPSRKSTKSVFDSFRKLFKRVHRRRRRGGRDRKPLLIKILVGITIAVIAAIASAITIDRLSISSSKLVHAGGAPQTPVLDVKFDYDRYKVIFHVKTGVKFKNFGLKIGHVDRVVVAPVGLTPAPEIIRVIYLDKRDIGWLQEKEIRCEFLMEVGFKQALVKENLPRMIWQFAIYFYAPDGSELYWEQLEARAVPPPS